MHQHIDKIRDSGLIRDSGQNYLVHCNSPRRAG